MIALVKGKLKSEFLRGVLTLVTGTTLASLITIAATPLLTRMYSPTDFGVLALYMSILAILSVIACGRYELAIILPDNEQDAANLFTLSVLISFGISLLALALVVLYYAGFASIAPSPLLFPWLWLLPLSLLLSGLIQTATYWMTRHKDYKQITVSQVNQTAAGTGFQIAWGTFAQLSAAGLIIGHLVGLLASAKTLLWGIFRRNIKPSLPVDGLIGLKSQAIIQKDFPLFSSWAAVLNTLSIHLPIFLIGAFFPAAIAGYFAVANRFMALPMRLIGNSVGQVFYQHAAEAMRKGELRPLILAITKRLTLIIIPPVLVFCIFAPWGFQMLLGDEWRPAGLIAQALSLYVAIQFIISPVSTTGSLLGLQKLSLIWTIGRTIGSVCALSIGGIIQSYLTAISLYSAFNCIAFILLFMLYLYHSKRSDQDKVNHPPNTEFYPVR